MARSAVGTGPLLAVSELTKAADDVLHRDPAYRQEMAQWVRPAPAPDGVPAQTAGYRPEPQDLLPQRPFTDRGPARRPRL